MKIVSWNILAGFPTREGGNLVDSINQFSADVIALQEVDHLQKRSGNIKTTQLVSENCGYPHWGFAPTLYGTPGSKWREAEHFSTSRSPIELPTSYGISLLSRIPVISWHVLRLNRSPIGLPLLITTEKGSRVGYVEDEPRAAIAAVLENGSTVVAAHFSFVPPVNSRQLAKTKTWANNLPGKKIFIGDFNALIFGKAGLKSLHPGKSYPSWGAKVKFDYMLSDDLKGEVLDLPYLGVSDHLPIGLHLKS